MENSRFLAATIAASLTVPLVGCGDTAAPPAQRATGYDVERYDLRGELDWSRRRLVATVDIILTATEPNVGRIVLDSAVDSVKGVRAGAAPVPFAIDEKTEKLTVDVGSLALGEQLVLHVDYEAAPGRGLSAVAARAGDPVTSRAVYTSSEPASAHAWMPCHDRPDDRALFSVEMKMDEGESMIANGDVELDEESPEDGRRMRYATRVPLPTYLMAFAVSDFEVEKKAQGDVPISVWHRRGVPGDYPGLLHEIGREIDLYAERLGPYPFDAYALVMLPDFSGGMENAGITFQTESRSAQPSLGSDVALGAHELGHQWFGDLVTVATWNDLWIKEGMATLLSAEARRAVEDQSDSGTLLGDSFGAHDGDAIRDRRLPAGKKYTSGPYDRAAWLFTQVRAVVGKKAFWRTLRGLLQEHRFGVVSTKDVLDAFAPALGHDASERAQRAVDAKVTPKIGVGAAPMGGAYVTLHDPEGTLIAPMEIEWRHEDGTVERHTLVPEEPFELRREAAGDFLVIDPRDVHPDWSSLFTGEESAQSFDTLVAPLRAPASAGAASRFLELAGVHQAAAIEGRALPPIAPEDFADFVAALDADSARALSIGAACEVASGAKAPSTKLAWRGVIAELLSTPYYAGLGFVGSYGACADVVDSKTLFAAEWAELADGLARETVSEPRVVFLSKLALPPAEGFTLWSTVAEHGYSVRVRAIAARQLRRYAEEVEKGIGVDRAAWRARVASLIRGSEVSSVRDELDEAAKALKAD